MNIILIYFNNRLLNKKRCCVPHVSQSVENEMFGSPLPFLRSHSLWLWAWPEVVSDSIKQPHMGFYYKADLKTLVHTLLPIDFPPPLKQIMLQYSGHLFVGRGTLTWTLFS